MSSFNYIKKSQIGDSFRVEKIKGKFDLQNKESVESFSGKIDIEDRDWNIGVIVGRSGTGKTTIAKEYFKEGVWDGYNYKEKSIIDDFYKWDVDITTAMFNSVGFSSPPSWLKPYSVLSNGEKMRVDLAMALLENKDITVFDEFTSVVDRDVAKIGSLAVSKTIRKQKKKFVAVTCHYDIIDWLEPDWIFDTNKMVFFAKMQEARN